MTLSRDYNAPWNDEQRLPTFQCPRCRCIWQWEKDEPKTEAQKSNIPDIGNIDDINKDRSFYRPQDAEKDKRPWYKQFWDGFTLKKLREW